jgi:hypothetical protein
LSCAEAEVRGKIELVLFSKVWVTESAWVVEGARAYPPARIRPLASKNGRGFFALADEDEVGFVAYPLTAPRFALRVCLAGLTPSETGTGRGSRVDKSRAAMVAIRFDSKGDVMPEYEV